MRGAMVVFAPQGKTTDRYTVEAPGRLCTVEFASSRVLAKGTVLFGESGKGGLKQRMRVFAPLSSAREGWTSGVDNETVDVARCDRFAGVPCRL